ncbi:hypothetical protein IFM89_000897 [Coptis chinensis]|uniref:HHO5-like N-terminal domain-containing protein n=1 Tax=Coptis chinensis TaxID=261450 RepID=A0A835M6J3_9MAGN|nr:hypothetical protein IFM89_000897 [Coptis chinensis]
MIDFIEKMKNTTRCEEYMEKLEVERQKIQVFNRELPLCLQLVNQAINICKSQVGMKNEGEDSEFRETPVLEEFFPVNQSLVPSVESELSNEMREKKIDWSKSAQLWNQEFTNQKDQPSQRTIVTESEERGGAFHPFHREKGPREAPVATTPNTTTAETVTGSEGDQRQGESHKKVRRSWSNELHRKFLNALQQLGGPRGINTDYIQKERYNSPANDNRQTPQFIVVKDLLVPAQERTEERPATGEAAQVVANRVYAPVAARPQLPSVACSPQQKQQQSITSPYYSEGRSSNTEHCKEDEDTNSAHPPHLPPLTAQLFLLPCLNIYVH